MQGNGIGNEQKTEKSMEVREILEEGAGLLEEELRMELESSGYEEMELESRKAVIRNKVREKAKEVGSKLRDEYLRDEKSEEEILGLMEFMSKEFHVEGRDKREYEELVKTVEKILKIGRKQREAAEKTVGRKEQVFGVEREREKEGIKEEKLLSESKERILTLCEERKRLKEIKEEVLKSEAGEKLTREEKVLEILGSEGFFEDSEQAVRNEYCMEGAKFKEICVQAYRNDLTREEKKEEELEVELSELKKEEERKFKALEEVEKQLNVLKLSSELVEDLTRKLENIAKEVRIKKVDILGGEQEGFGKDCGYTMDGYQSRLSLNIRMMEELKEKGEKIKNIMGGKEYKDLCELERRAIEELEKEIGEKLVVLANKSGIEPGVRSIFTLNRQIEEKRKEERQKECEQSEKGGYIPGKLGRRIPEKVEVLEKPAKELTEEEKRFHEELEGLKTEQEHYVQEMKKIDRVKIFTSEETEEVKRLEKEIECLELSSGLIRMRGNRVTKIELLEVLKQGKLNDLNESKKILQMEYQDYESSYDILTWMLSGGAEGGYRFKAEVKKVKESDLELEVERLKLGEDAGVIETSSETKRSMVTVVRGSAECLKSLLLSNIKLELSSDACDNKEKKEEIRRRVEEKQKEIEDIGKKYRIDVVDDISRIRGWEKGVGIKVETTDKLEVKKKRNEEQINRIKQDLRWKESKLLGRTYAWGRQDKEGLFRKWLNDEGLLSKLSERSKLTEEEKEKIKLKQSEMKKGLSRYQEGLEELESQISEEMELNDKACDEVLLMLRQSGSGWERLGSLTEKEEHDWIPLKYQCEIDSRKLKLLEERVEIAKKKNLGLRVYENASEELRHLRKQYENLKFEMCLAPKMLNTLGGVYESQEIKRLELERRVFELRTESCEIAGKLSEISVRKENLSRDNEKLADEIELLEEGLKPYVDVESNGECKDESKVVKEREAKRLTDELVTELREEFIEKEKANEENERKLLGAQKSLEEIKGRNESLKAREEEVALGLKRVKELREKIDKKQASIEKLSNQHVNIGSFLEELSLRMKRFVEHMNSNAEYDFSTGYEVEIGGMIKSFEQELKALEVKIGRDEKELETWKEEYKSKQGKEYESIEDKKVIKSRSDIATLKASLYGKLEEIELQDSLKMSCLSKDIEIQRGELEKEYLSLQDKEEKERVKSISLAMVNMYGELEKLLEDIAVCTRESFEELRKRQSEIIGSGTFDEESDVIVSNFASDTWIEIISGLYGLCIKEVKRANEFEKDSCVLEGTLSTYNGIDTEISCFELEQQGFERSRNKAEESLKELAEKKKQLEDKKKQLEEKKDSEEEDKRKLEEEDKKKLEEELVALTEEYEAKESEIERLGKNISECQEKIKIKVGEKHRIVSEACIISETHGKSLGSSSAEEKISNLVNFISERKKEHEKIKAGIKGFNTFMQERSETLFTLVGEDADYQLKKVNFDGIEVVDVKEFLRKFDGKMQEMLSGSSKGIGGSIKRTAMVIELENKLEDLKEGAKTQEEEIKARKNLRCKNVELVIDRSKLKCMQLEMGALREIKDEIEGLEEKFDSEVKKIVGRSKRQGFGFEDVRSVVMEKFLSEEGSQYGCAGDKICDREAVCREEVRQDRGKVLKLVEKIAKTRQDLAVRTFECDGLKDKISGLEEERQIVSDLLSSKNVNYNKQLKMLKAIENDQNVHLAVTHDLAAYSTDASSFNDEKTSKLVSGLISLGMTIPKKSLNVRDPKEKGFLKGVSLESLESQMSAKAQKLSQLLNNLDYDMHVASQQMAKHAKQVSDIDSELKPFKISLNRMESDISKVRVVLQSQENELKTLEAKISSRNEVINTFNELRKLSPDKRVKVLAIMSKIKDKLEAEMVKMTNEKEGIMGVVSSESQELEMAFEELRNDKELSRAKEGMTEEERIKRQLAWAKFVGIKSEIERLGKEVRDYAFEKRRALIKGTRDSISAKNVRMKKVKEEGEEGGLIYSDEQVLRERVVVLENTKEGAQARIDSEKRAIELLRESAIRTQANLEKEKSKLRDMTHKMEKRRVKIEELKEESKVLEFEVKSASEALGANASMLRKKEELLESVRAELGKKTKLLSSLEQKQASRKQDSENARSKLSEEKAELELREKKLKVEVKSLQDVQMEVDLRIAELLQLARNKSTELEVTESNDNGEDLKTSGVKKIRLLTLRVRKIGDEISAKQRVIEYENSVIDRAEKEKEQVSKELRERGEQTREEGEKERGSESKYWSTTLIGAIQSMIDEREREINEYWYCEENTRISSENINKALRVYKEELEGREAREIGKEERQDLGEEERIFKRKTLPFVKVYVSEEKGSTLRSLSRNGRAEDLLEEEKLELEAKEGSTVESRIAGVENQNIKEARALLEAKEASEILDKIFEEKREGFRYDREQKEKLISLLEESLVQMRRGYVVREEDIVRKGKLAREQELVRLNNLKEESSVALAELKADLEETTEALKEVLEDIVKLEGEPNRDTGEKAKTEDEEQKSKSAAIKLATVKAEAEKASKVMKGLSSRKEAVEKALVKAEENERKALKEEDWILGLVDEHSKETRALAVKTLEIKGREEDIKKINEEQKGITSSAEKLKDRNNEISKLSEGLFWEVLKEETEEETEVKAVLGKEAEASEEKVEEAEEVKEGEKKGGEKVEETEEEKKEKMRISGLIGKQLILYKSEGIIGNDVYDRFSQIGVGKELKCGLSCGKLILEGLKENLEEYKSNIKSIKELTEKSKKVENQRKKETVVLERLEKEEKELSLSKIRIENLIEEYRNTRDTLEQAKKVVENIEFLECIVGDAREKVKYGERAFARKRNLLRVMGLEGGNKAIKGLLSRVKALEGGDELRKLELEIGRKKGVLKILEGSVAEVSTAIMGEGKQGDEGDEEREAISEQEREEREVIKDEIVSKVLSEIKRIEAEIKAVERKVKERLNERAKKEKEARDYRKVAEEIRVLRESISKDCEKLALLEKEAGVVSTGTLLTEIENLEKEKEKINIRISESKEKLGNEIVRLEMLAGAMSMGREEIEEKLNKIEKKKRALEDGEKEEEIGIEVTDSEVIRLKSVHIAREQDGLSFAGENLEVEIGYLLLVDKLWEEEGIRRGVLSRLGEEEQEKLPGLLKYREDLLRDLMRVDIVVRQHETSEISPVDIRKLREQKKSREGLVNTLRVTEGKIYEILSDTIHDLAKQLSKKCGISGMTVQKLGSAQKEALRKMSHVVESPDFLIAESENVLPDNLSENSGVSVSVQSEDEIRFVQVESFIKKLICDMRLNARLGETVISMSYNRWATKAKKIYDSAVDRVYNYLCLMLSNQIEWSEIAISEIEVMINQGVGLEPVHRPGGVNEQQETLNKLKVELETRVNEIQSRLNTLRKMSDMKNPYNVELLLTMLSAETVELVDELVELKAEAELLEKSGQEFSEHQLSLRKRYELLKVKRDAVEEQTQGKKEVMNIKGGASAYFRKHMKALQLKRLAENRDLDQRDSDRSAQEKSHDLDKTILDKSATLTGSEAREVKDAFLSSVVENPKLSVLANAVSKGFQSCKFESLADVHEIESDEETEEATKLENVTAEKVSEHGDAVDVDSSVRGSERGRGFDTLGASFLPESRSRMVTDVFAPEQGGSLNDSLGGSFGESMSLTLRRARFDFTTVMQMAPVRGEEKPQVNASNKLYRKVFRTQTPKADSSVELTELNTSNEVPEGIEFSGSMVRRGMDVTAPRSQGMLSSTRSKRAKPLSSVRGTPLSKGRTSDSPKSKLGSSRVVPGVNSMRQQHAK